VIPRGVLLGLLLALPATGEDVYHLSIGDPGRKTRDVPHDRAQRAATSIDAQDPDHLRLFKASFDDATFHAGMTDGEWEAMLNAQCTWDATMGFQAVRALAREPR